jgi:hypothetical protein
MRLKLKKKMKDERKSLQVYWLLFPIRVSLTAPTQQIEIKRVVEEFEKRQADELAEFDRKKQEKDGMLSAVSQFTFDLPTEPMAT